MRAPIPPQFEKLREMESFTDEMFNRIVEFQERMHPAWNENAPFAERISRLPLHALIFSNPDRNPATHAQTVAPFYPLRAELRQIVACAKQVADDPLVCDVHGRNGFLGSLLGREGVRVIGVRDPADKPNQIERFYDSRVYEPLELTLDELTRPFDVAFSAWMPSGIDRTPQIVAHRPKLIVFVHTEHSDETGRPQTGTWSAYHELPDNYLQIAEWTVERPRDLLHEVWPDLTPSIAETRIVRIYADEPWQHIHVDSEVESVDPYDWELDLDMALTALEAKEALRARGFSV
ncbi:MAG: hypothetical protein RBT81_00235 [Gammaproteobacteria bacterium]|nr:hypothetical protein [Gammaproteobacteria bacterium]